ncbi:MAG: hypothetical protein GWN99_09825, partial [Gemmatimonadetes bacterium]|nr:hypothetical protein [Gemmatimonadota bacterium]NIR74166.1 hypothetical protein [Candidatus Kutchimonas denitrificans]NIS01348.1 hypothetical protein [Gemmatimonadota bacterium]NIT67079.1 hypothetical protein [Gemmatimonadota bacterium]NIU51739.1 hypothetical protein [Gemmatimonadota bacterium]
TSENAAGALAIAGGRSADRVGAPDGWGSDLIDRERWVRWTNGLGPPDQDVAPGDERQGFVIAAEPDTRPGIAEYRLQAAHGLPRGCESDDRFLKNSKPGFTVAPERLDTSNSRERAGRLKRLVDRACVIAWVDAADCPGLQRAAAALFDARAPGSTELARFRETLATARMSREAEIVLGDAERSVREVVDPTP